jgi:hypothetical protein
MVGGLVGATAPQYIGPPSGPMLVQSANATAARVTSAAQSTVFIVKLLSFVVGD